MPSMKVPAGAAGLTALWQFPDEGWDDRWDAIFVPGPLKDRLRNYVVFALRHASDLSSVRFPVHRIALLSGPPGTGKTTLARGVAQQAARAILDEGGPHTVLAEIDTHAFASELLGGSQRSVTKLLRQTIPDLAMKGDPLIVLLDEVENLAVRRAAVSTATNPIDVHRATNAVLTGLDTLSAQYDNLVFVCTTNYVATVDDALLSRLDLTLHTTLPERELARQILVDTMAALRRTDVADLDPQDADLAALLDLVEDMDARRLRKLLLEAVISDARLVADPESLDWDDVTPLLKERA